MTFPVDAGTNTYGSSGVNTSHAVNLPASIAAGDLLILLVCNNGTTPTITTPTGWTALFASTNPVGSIRFSAYYRVADGSEGSTVSITTSSSQLACNAYRITGSDTATAPAVANTSGSGTGSSADPPSLTPSWGALDTLWIAAAESERTAAQYTGDPAGFSAGFTSASTTGNRASVRSAEAAINTATENPAAFTLSGTALRMGITIGIKPAPAANFVPWTPTPQLGPTLAQ